MERARHLDDTRKTLLKPGFRDPSFVTSMPVPHREITAKGMAPIANPARSLTTAIQGFIGKSAKVGARTLHAKIHSTAAAHDDDRPYRGEMIRYYASIGLQLVGLFITLESLLLYFGDMGPMLRTATVGIGVFYAGRWISPRDD